MYIPDELRKTTAFKDVRIPDNATLFGRVGSQNAPSAGFYTGDADAQMPTDKVTQLSRGERIAMAEVRALAAENANKQREIEENRRLADEARAAKKSVKSESE